MGWALEWSDGGEGGLREMRSGRVRIEGVWRRAREGVTEVFDSRRLLRDQHYHHHHPPSLSSCLLPPSYASYVIREAHTPSSARAVCYSMLTGAASFHGRNNGYGWDKRPVASLCVPSGAYQGGSLGSARPSKLPHNHRPHFRGSPHPRHMLGLHSCFGQGKFRPIFIFFLSFIY